MWSGALRAARALGPAPLFRSWEPAGGPVLMVAPHPDDETVGAGGTLALHAQAGDPVTVLVVTDGRRSGAGGLAPEEMARRRKIEVREAVAELGLEPPVLLDRPEGAWDADELEGVLATEIGRSRVVYAPGPVDFHPEHLRVARTLARTGDFQGTVRVCELGVPLLPTLVNRVVDVAPVAVEKGRALERFRTQRENLAPLARLARYRASLYGVEEAEVFWELSGPGYVAAVEAADRVDASGPFRGIRRHAVSDPLTLLSGLGQRRRLRDAVRAVPDEP